MPRPTIDLEPYKAEITALYQRNEPVAAIQDYLKESFNLQLSKRTLESLSINTDVQARIKVLFFQVGLEDKDILYVLHQEGVTLSPCTLRRMRKSLGLVRCTESLFERQRQTEAILQALLEESEKGRIQGFGRRLLYQYMCTRGYIITRIYCGITARTALSVLNQFLNVVETVQLQSQKIRSDHGSERGRFQNIYLQLQQVYDPSIQLADCWLEGRSTENQRIKAWWEQLLKSALYKWWTYFRTLKDEGLFSKSCTADQITLLSIYMPIICTEIYSYIELWNVHQIRKQQNRPNSVTGKPYMLYYYPKEGVRDYGLPIKQEVLDYLPVETLQFCCTALLGISFDPERPPPLQPEDKAAPFYTIYLELREIISFYIDLFIESFLGLSSQPTAGARLNPEIK
ncbi:hypothetical protein BDV26DRAFT_284469 [Aspergillus bertholletiae]|uniref:Clr5 domain-containing protein n=1 Tax=Aspergillus bertholletiae TaxID=1226010 RepID=A0A5N7AWU5_9EURO|nr:hypothetical protein BDV26DRAFT_284469 [Aspergillus bertholletiae]